MPVYKALKSFAGKGSRENLQALYEALKPGLSKNGRLSKYILSQDENADIDAEKQTVIFIYIKSDLCSNINRVLRAVSTEEEAVRYVGKCFSSYLYNKSKKNTVRERIQKAAQKILKQYPAADKESTWDTLHHCKEPKKTPKPDLRNLFTRTRRKKTGETGERINKDLLKQFIDYLFYEYNPELSVHIVIEQLIKNGVNIHSDDFRTRNDAIQLNVENPAVKSILPQDMHNIKNAAEELYLSLTSEEKYIYLNMMIGTMKTKEIARKTGMSFGTINNRKNSVSNKIKSVIKSYALKEKHQAVMLSEFYLKISVENHSIDNKRKNNG